MPEQNVTISIAEHIELLELRKRADLLERRSCQLQNLLAMGVCAVRGVLPDLMYPSSSRAAVLRIWLDHVQEACVARRYRLRAKEERRNG